MTDLADTNAGIILLRQFESPAGGSWEGNQGQ